MKKELEEKNNIMEKTTEKTTEKTKHVWKWILFHTSCYSYSVVWYRYPFVSRFWG